MASRPALAGGVESHACYCVPSISVQGRVTDRRREPAALLVFWLSWRFWRVDHELAQICSSYKYVISSMSEVHLLIALFLYSVGFSLAKTMRHGRGHFTSNVTCFVTIHLTPSGRPDPFSCVKLYSNWLPLLRSPQVPVYLCCIGLGSRYFAAWQVVKTAASRQHRIPGVRCERG